jgi:diguanylate cyclase (GGDEF)-like protein
MQEMAEHVRAERLRFVFIQSALPIIFSPLAAAILSLTLRSSVDHRLLIAWTLTLALIAIFRVIVVRLFARLPEPAVHVKRWEQIFVASILLVDVCWGFGALALLPAGLTERALVFSFVMLMAGGHTASYSAHPLTVISGVLALTLPLTIWFALQLDAFHAALAFVSVMFLVASFRSIKTLGYFFERTHRLAYELQKSKERTEELARLDFLTSLCNRRAFYETSTLALRLAKDNAQPLALLMVDIDLFKAINDQFGHAAGDSVIRSTADLIRDAARPHDLTGRLGGEEFAMLLPETTLEEACAIADRIRANAEALGVTHSQQKMRFTISAGVCAFDRDDTLDMLLARADAALYDAKRNGRNRVLAATAT